MFVSHHHWVWSQGTQILALSHELGPVQYCRIFSNALLKTEPPYGFMSLVIIVCCCAIYSLPTAQPAWTGDTHTSLVDFTACVHINLALWLFFLLDTGHGTLYTSDGSGIVFDKSLKKHLYPNDNDLTDFYKVRSHTTACW